MFGLKELKKELEGSVSEIEERLDKTSKKLDGYMDALCTTLQGIYLEVQKINRSLEEMKAAAPPKEGGGK